MNIERLEFGVILVEVSLLQELFWRSRFLRCCSSSAGNHDNRNYEADWGEKWQGLLENVTVEDDERSNDFNFNKTNYDNQANQLLAGNLKENYS